MALDGIVIANIIYELRNTLLGGRINKISQPERDELVFTIKGQPREPYKLLISASAGMPLIYLCSGSKPSPMTAPNFCMLLRKHLNNAVILDISQPGLERIVNIKLKSSDELGDVRIKYLIAELMGKHSNIIFCDEDMTIIDSIKRVNQFVSSVREVLPGRSYFIPHTVDKADPLSLDYDGFQKYALTKPMEAGKALYTGLTGISPLIANELCCRASIDAAAATDALSESESLHLFRNFERLMEAVKDCDFTPNIVLKNNIPAEFSSVKLSCYEGYDIKQYTSVSEMLEAFYADRDKASRNRQRSADLRKLVANAIDRTRKKYDLQLKQLEDTEKREKYRVYGELITSYGYGLEPGAKVLEAVNYYDGKEISIPLDPTITPVENAKQYFEKYSKLKRTYEALSAHIKETAEELEHLRTIQAALDFAADENDLADIRRELAEYGYIKKGAVISKGRGTGKASVHKAIKSIPLHYVSSDGYHIYVGKNNLQNEELTFRMAEGGDWWFHAKNIPGSHVIVKAGGAELPDRTFEEAARLAAHYSAAEGMDKVEIDYTLKKNVKKPAGAKPGFVIYHTNYSMIAGTDISDIKSADS